MFLLPDLKSLLTQIVGHSTVSSANPELDRSNKDLVEILSIWLSRLGLQVQIQELPNAVGKYNLIATTGSGTGGLVLAGHTDTVPYTEDLWTFNPLRLTEDNGRLYGLGVCDMKSFFAFVIEAIRDLDLTKIQRPLVIIGTANEEVNMYGAQALLTNGNYAGYHALIGEPTNMLPVRMHKGILMESIQITGKAAHASNPDLGVSALEGMHKVMNALLQWRKVLQTKYCNPAFQVPTPTLNLGRIWGGDSPNRVCERCELHFDLRPLPGMDPEWLRSEIGTILDQTLQESRLSWKLSQLFPGIGAMETPATATIVKLTEELSNTQAGVVDFATEAPYFSQMGMQTVILGPGDIAQAHQPNEYLAVDRISPYISMLRHLIQRVCFTAN